MARTPKEIFLIHLSIIGLLAAAYGGVIVLGQLGHEKLFGLNILLNPGKELSVPNYFSSLALIATGLAAWAVRGKLAPTDAERKGWTIFAWVFLFLALDEAIQIHETLSGYAPFGLEGTEAYIPFVIPFGFIMFRFWLRQPTSIKIAILGAGILYIFAAIFMEVNEWHLVRDDHLTYRSLAVELNEGGEEFGEMVAVALFLKTFLMPYAMLGGGFFVQLQIGGLNQTATAPQAEANSQVYA